MWPGEPPPGTAPAPTCGAAPLLHPSLGGGGRGDAAGPRAEPAPAPCTPTSSRVQGLGICKSLNDLYENEVNVHNF